MISCQNISVVRNKKTLVNSVDLKIPEGSFFSVLGPNGAGKTTLLRAISGIDVNYSGQIEINHREFNSYSRIELSRILTWIPETTSIPFDFTALDLTVLGRFPWHQGHPSKLDHSRAEEALDTVGILDKANQPLTSMSSGERRKVMLARAVASDAKIIVLDEPLANLDPQAQIHDLKILKSLCSQGKTVVASMHELSLAQKTSTHSVLMKNGLAVDSGSTDKVLTVRSISEVFNISAEYIADSAGSKHLILGE